MSAVLTEAKALLLADTTLVAQATGGIYTNLELGRLGINRNNQTIFANGLIKPTLVIKIRTSTVVDGVADDVAQVSGRRTMLEVWGYQDNGYAIIESMFEKVYTALQGKRVGGVACRWQFDGPQSYDEEIDACVQRADYAVYSLRK